MYDLSSLISKYQHLLKTRAGLKTSVCEVVEECAGVVLDRKQVKIQDNCIFISSHSFIKNEIFLHQKIIIKKLQDKTGTKIKAIR